MKSSKTWLLLAAIALAATLRLTAAFSLGRSPLLLHPVLEDLAYKTQALSPDASGVSRALPRGSVLYPRFVASIPGIAEGDVRSLAVAQCACELVTVILLALLVRRRWGTLAAAAAAALYALDPLGAFFAARFSPVVPATLLFVAFVLLWDHERGREHPSLLLGLAAGVVSALGFLLMPLPFLFLVALRLWERVKTARRAGAGPAWASAVVPVVFLLITGGGLVARHAHLPGGGPALSWGAGPAIDHAFDPATAGTPRWIRPPAWIPDSELRRRTWEEIGRPGTEFDIYRTAAARGVSRALANPLSTVGVILSKVVATCGAWPIPDALSAGFIASRSAKQFSWLAWSFAGLLALGVAGGLLLRGDPLRGTLVLGLLAVALASLLGMASAASRQAALPLLAALGGGWLAGAAGRAPGRCSRTPLIGLGIALVVSLAAGLLGPGRALRNPSEDLRLLASTFEQTLNWRQAVPVLEEAVRRDPRNLEARLELGQAYLKDALPAAATEQFETAYRADSTHAGVTAALASLRFTSGQTEEALTLMHRLVQAHPRHAGYLRDYGTWLGQVGRMSEAETALSQAVRIDPSDEAATRSLQEVVNIRMSLENSLFPGELRTNQDPAYEASLPRIIDAMEKEQWARADSLLSWAEQTHSQLATTHWMRAGYLARRGDLAGSIAALERCLRIAPGRPAVVAQLTQLYVQNRQPTKVLPLFRESLIAASGDSVVTRQLRMLARDIGLPLDQIRR